MSENINQIFTTNITTFSIHQHSVKPLTQIIIDTSRLSCNPNHRSQTIVSSHCYPRLNCSKFANYKQPDVRKNF